jgi:hypothetical protein
MSGLLHPVGPEPPQTYWARRGLAFGATLVLGVAVVLIISGTSSGSAAQPSPAGVAYSTPPAASATSVSPTVVTPSPSATSTGPTPETRKVSTTKKRSAECSTDDLRPTLTGKQRLKTKQPTTFQLSLINGSAEACIVRVTQKNFQLEIESGNHRIWSTEDCPSIIKPISRTLGSEHAVAWTLTWDGKRSKPNCRSAHKALRPGRYLATAQLDGAEPVQLRLTLK